MGVKALRDDDLSTYWQSDGPQPHRVTLVFKKAVQISKVSIYLDFHQDESYTPSKLALKAGNTLTDLQDLMPAIEVHEPVEWVDFVVDEPTRIFMLQILVLANHHD
ncbi:MAG: hypothetical protein SGCHY_003971, partial [Lobulomycetales sp.]